MRAEGEIDKYIRMFSTRQGVLSPKPANKNNRDAVTLGRLGGLKGGKARATTHSSAKRIEIAKKAALARWGK